MDHANIHTVELESENCFLWIDQEWWHEGGQEYRAADLTVESSFSLTTKNIYDIIAELQRVAAWLEKDE